MTGPSQLHDVAAAPPRAPAATPLPGAPPDGAAPAGDGFFAFLGGHADFRRFWAGQVVSQLGDRVHTLAVIWLVYAWTRSGTMLAVVLIASTLPSILISPWAGTLADRVDRRRLAIASDLARFVLVLLLAVLAHLGRLGLASLTAVTALIAIASAFFNPATFALIPSLVEPRSLVRANAVSQLSATACGALGFVLGSGLIALIGVTVAFAANALSFLASALMLRAIQRREPVRAAAGSWTADFRAGWAVIRSIPVVSKILGTVVLVNLVFSALPVLIPIFGEGVFRAGSAGVGLLLAAFTAGMFGGAALLAAAALDTTIGRVMVVGLGLIGAAFVLMGVAVRLPVFAGALIVVGFCLNVVNISLLGLFQAVIPTETRGKFFSLLTAVSLSSQPVAYGLTGWLADVVKPQLLLLVCGGCILLVAAALPRVKELGAHRIRG